MLDLVSRVRISWISVLLPPWKPLLEGLAPPDRTYFCTRITFGSVLAGGLLVRVNVYFMGAAIASVKLQLFHGI